MMMITGFLKALLIYNINTAHNVDKGTNGEYIQVTPHQ